MPLHRRKIYFDHSLSRKRRSEEWLSYSIFLAFAILILCLLGSSPEVLSHTAIQARTPDVADHLGTLSQLEQIRATLCEFLGVVSGAYLALALFIKSQNR